MIGRRQLGTDLAVDAAGTGAAGTDAAVTDAAVTDGAAMDGAASPHGEKALRLLQAEDKGSVIEWTSPWPQPQNFKCSDTACSYANCGRSSGTLMPHLGPIIPLAANPLLTGYDFWKLRDESQDILKKAIGKAKFEKIEMSWAAWGKKWNERLIGWWAALPMMQQRHLSNCLGALGLHVGARFDAAQSAWLKLLGQERPPPLSPTSPVTPGAVPEDGCEWLNESRMAERDLQLPSFPQMPSEPDAFRAPLLPIPRLLPSWQRDLFMQSLASPSSDVMPQLAPSWESVSVGAAGGIALGLAAALLRRGLSRGGTGSRVRMRPASR